MPLPPCLLLTESMLRSTVRLDAPALAVIEDAFTRLARGDAEMPPPMGIDVREADGEIHVKSAYIRGLPSLAVKIASGFYRNPARGLPTSSGLIALLSAETGFPSALLLDNAYLTDLRTALAGAVAAKHLAPERVEVVGVVGAGVQARLQVEALALVRRFRTVLVWARRSDAAQAYAHEMSDRLRLEVAPCSNVAELVRRADVVITATPSRVALVPADSLHQGLHITAMGSDGPGKQELDPTVLRKADRVVCDQKAQCFRLGELQHALRTGDFSEDSPIDELGELTAGTKPGRRSAREITVCDLTGAGVQDTAIALHALQRAREEGLGVPLQG